jgi:hypothetical protein
MASNLIGEALQKDSAWGRDIALSLGKIPEDQNLDLVALLLRKAVAHLDSEHGAEFAKAFEQAAVAAICTALNISGSADHVLKH